MGRAEIPNPGKNARERDMWLAWRSVIETGITKTRNKKLRALVDLIGSKAHSTEGLQRHLLDIILDTDTGRSLSEVQAAWEELDVVRQGCLHLVRAGPENYVSVDHARELAIDAFASIDECRQELGIDPSRRDRVQTFRKGDNGEYHVLKRWFETTRERYIEAGAGLEGTNGAGRSHGKASQTASQTADGSLPEPGRFWTRQSTSEILAAIAREGQLTIYLGTDGDCDVGTFSRGELYSQAIRRKLTEINEGDRVSPSALGYLGARVPSSHLGSILRQLHSGEPAYHRESEQVLDEQLRACAAGRIRDGSLARNVTYLAFAERHADHDIELMSEVRRAELSRAARDRRDRYPPFADIDYAADDEPSKFTRRLRLIDVHGREDDSWAQSLAVGELDFEADPALGRREGLSRAELLRQALLSRSVLFVGTNLTDPALISALARAADSPHRRYALVVPPNYEDLLKLDDTDRAGVRWLLARRYLHLGVAPVFVDLPSELSQALREIAIRVERGRDYVRYEDRLAHWTDQLREVCAIEMDESGCSVDDSTRSEWRDALGEMLASSSSTRSLEAEFWVYNWRRDTLYRLAGTGKRRKRGSEANLWPGAGAALPREGRSEALAVRAFQSGHSTEGELDDGDARFGIAFNLVEYAPGWERLPVGVITILSSKGDDAAFRKLASNRARRGPLENLLSGSLRDRFPVY